MADVDQILAPLNPEQKTAVMAAPGPVQVFAGPGSGKTRVLTHRIAYLIATGQVRPEQICAVTFTNKAAREMKERLEQMIDRETVRRMQVSTSHSLGLRIIKEHPDEVGRRRNLSIYAEDEQRHLLRELMERNQVNSDRLGDALDFIGQAKNSLKTPAMVKDDDSVLAKLYDDYELELQRANAVDFDDLLKLPVELFRAHPEILAEYQRRHSCLFVDEYQDTNKSQYQFFKLLASKSRQITVVGDDDQCLAKGTAVKLGNGTLKLIEQVVVGDLVLASFGGELRAARVSRCHRQAAKRGIKLTTESGRELVSTATHTHFAGYPDEALRHGLFRVALTLGENQDGHSLQLLGFGTDAKERLVAAGLELVGEVGEVAGVVVESANWAELLIKGQEIRKLSGAEIWLQAKLGKVGAGRVALPLRAAQQVMPGMLLFDENGELDRVRAMEAVDLDDDVFDLDVEGAHNFIANGLITHNSIYGWRGADYSNILSFRSDYPEAETVVLDRNYRSTQHVLEVAKGLIRHNQQRQDKNLWSPRKEERHAVLCSVNDDREEASYVVQEITRLTRDDGLAHNDFAILYRTNAQSRAFETALNQARIPYQIANGTAFYDRREIRDVIAYLKFLVNPQDLVAFQRIVNVPARGIGKKTVELIMSEAEAQGESPLEVLRLMTWNEIRTKKAYYASKDFVAMIDELRTAASHLSVDQLLELLLEKSKYLESFSLMRVEEREMRTDNVFELLSYTRDGGERVGLEAAAEFLQETSLMTDVDGLDETKPQVTLATLHKAKGLEFPVVFVTGVEEGLLPHDRCHSHHEERCLLYVGITRAKDKLYLTQAQMRQRFGKMTYTRPSRFLDEIPAELLQSIELDPYSLAV